MQFGRRKELLEPPHLHSVSGLATSRLLEYSAFAPSSRSWTLSLSLFNRNSTCFSEVFNLRFKLLLAAYSTQIARVISCASCDFRLGTFVPVSNLQISVSLPMLYSRISALQPCALHISLYAGHRLKCRIVHCSPMSFLFTAAYTSYRFVSFRIHNNASRQRRGLRTSCALMRVNSLVWR